MFTRQFVREKIIKTCNRKINKQLLIIRNQSKQLLVNENEKKYISNFIRQTKKQNPWG